MKYFLNGVDIEATYGCVITNGMDMFFQLPGRKDSVDNDFEDEDGEDIDLTAPKFKARPFGFNCTIDSTGPSDFKTKFFGMFAILKQQDTYTLYNDFFDMTLNLYYIDQTNPSGMYKTEKGIAMSFTLNFGETDPFGNMPIVELIDDLGNVLVP